MPTEAHPSGGTALTIRGVGIDEDATVVFRTWTEEGEAVDVEGDDTLVEDLEGGAQEVYVLTPEHDAGWADLVIVNPDGLETDPPYPFYFTEDATQPSDDDGNGGLRGCGVGGFAGSGPVAMLALLLVLGFVRAREGR